MPKKKWNPNYTDTDYKEEVSRYFNKLRKSTLKQFSLDACIRFMENLPDDEEANDEGFYDDGADYAMWGYALTGDWEEMEDEGQEMWKWVRFYEKFFGCDLLILISQYKKPTKLNEYIKAIE